MKYVNSFICFPSGLDWKRINFVLIQQIGHAIAQLSVQGNCTVEIRLNLPNHAVYKQQIYHTLQILATYTDALETKSNTEEGVKRVERDLF